MFSMIKIGQVFRYTAAVGVYLASLSMLLCSSAVFAADELIFANPLQYDTLEELLIALADGITIVLIPVVVLAIAYIGFKMVLAGREKTADYTKLKEAFAWSLIGLFLVLGARGILAVIRNTVDDVLGDEYKIGDCRKHGEEETQCKNKERCHNDSKKMFAPIDPSNPPDDRVLTVPLGHCGCSNDKCCKNGKNGPQCT